MGIKHPFLGILPGMMQLTNCDLEGLVSMQYLHAAGRAFHWTMARKKEYLNNLVCTCLLMGKFIEWHYLEILFVWM